MEHMTITEKCNGCDACTKICPVEAISGERKEIHVIDSTLCIGCKACGKTCPQEAIQDRFGNSITMRKRSLWPRPIFNYKKCMSCAICVDTCPVNCLGVSKRNERGDLHPYPFLKDEKSCISCSFCSIDCPVSAITMEAPVIEKTEGPQIYKYLEALDS